MDQENDNIETQDYAEEFANSLMNENDNGGAENPLEASTKSSEVNNKEGENPVEASTRSTDVNSGAAENPVEASTRSTDVNSGEAENPLEASTKLTVVNSGEPDNSAEASIKSSELNTEEGGVSRGKPTKAAASKKRIVKSLKAKSVVKKKASAKISLRAKVQKNDNTESQDPAEASAKSLAIEKINEEAEDPVEASTKLSEMSSKEAETPVEASSKSTEVNNGETENPVEASMNSGEAENPVEGSSKSSEMNTKEAGTSGERPTKAETSKKRFVKTLKAKSVVKKKASSKISLEAKKAEGNPQVLRTNKKKNKRLSQGNKGVNKNDVENGENVNVREENLEEDVSEIEPTGKGQESKEEEKSSGPSSSQHNRRSENDRDKRGKRSRRRNKKGKLDVKENIKGVDKKEEKLGGLIFMCSAKTKPDCFRYQVMGVTSGKKDLILGVKPGVKLFLYDFDLRLMYGVYKATSSGGMKLEPKAFGGSFPAQVRFGVHKDCVPLPESVFKKAIKENYNGKNKFDIELTFQQVRKLCALFRPVGFQSQPSTLAVHSSSRAKNRDREVERLRDSRPRTDRETFARGNGDGRSYPVHSHERDKRPVQREVVRKRREQSPPGPGLYMSEREYRTYGLQRERRNLSPPRAASTLDPYQRDLERERLHRHPSPYRETVPLRRETILVDPVYSTRRESQTYDYSGRNVLPSAAPSASVVTTMDPYARDPYYSYPHSTASRNAYVLPVRREEVYPGSYHVDIRRDVYAAAADPPRREIDDMDTLYLKYSVGPPTDYNQAYQPPKSEALLPPVSSRYSFAGPSMSYR